MGRAEKQKSEPADMLKTIESYIKKVEAQWSDLKAMKDAVILMASPEREKILIKARQPH